MSRVVLDSKCRELVFNVLQFMQLEKDNMGPIIPFTSYVKRAADALKISEKSVRRIMDERNGVKEVPTFKRNVVKCKTEDLPQGKKEDIRTAIYDLYKQHTHITIASLNNVLKEKFLFDGCDTSLRTLLHSMGFSYKKDDPRRGLCEQGHVVRQRFDFLRKYKSLVDENIYNFIFLDETWIFCKGGKKSSWQNESPLTCKKKQASEGKRFIVLHAGGKNGFLDGAGLIFSATSKSADYHDNMNAEMFKNWTKDYLLPALEEPTVVIMDNASYHSALEEKLPSSSWTKDALSTWLLEKNIPVPQYALKAHLLQLAQENMPKKKYFIDNLLLSKGHQVLRLPPYHCQYNPIEHIWGIAKNYYDHHMGSEGYGDDKVLSMWEKALQSISPEMWKNSVNHCDKLIKEHYEREILVDNVRELIININEDDEQDNEIDFDNLDD
jgi:transposase